MQGRKRNRKLDFDYSSEAIYFVTICTQNRVHYFGKIDSGKMNLSNFGKVAYEKCIWLENQYPYVKIHNFMIMPNHIHILFEINKIDKEVKRKSISSLIGAYKTLVSKEIHLLGNIDFSWQRSFHDHIVRTENRYENIYNYITNNPENWKKDKFYENN